MRSSGITWRSILIAIVLIPLNAWWLMQIEHIRNTDYASTTALFFNAVSILIILLGLSALIRWLMPSLALSRPELLVIYIVAVAGTNIGGHDQLQILLPTLSYVFRGADPANRWAQLIHPLLPRQLMPPEQGTTIPRLYEGGSSLYYSGHLSAWTGPLLWWGGFVIVVVFTMLCVCAIFRRQWDNERLNYPIAEVPLWITTPKRGLFINKLMWVAFGLAFTLRILTILPHFFPAFPQIPLGVHYYSTDTMPWRAAGSIPISSFPFIYGLAYLLPLQLAFSCWFFPLFGRLQLLLCAVLGLAYGSAHGDPPYLSQQELGAFLGVSGFIIWAARGHLKKVWRQAWGTKVLDDSDEPMPYQVAFWGFVVGMGVLIYFASFAGMRPLTALIYFVGLMAVVLTTARIRAEFGLPTIELCCQVGVDDAMQRVAGNQMWTPQDKTVWALFFFLNRTHRQFPMSNQMDALHIARQANMSLRWVTVVILAGFALGTVAALWAWLHVSYQVGLESARNMGPAVWAFGNAPWAKLASTLAFPRPPNIPSSVAYLVGMGVTFFLAAMRTRFLWWPFHPVGYLLVGSIGPLRIWFPIFVTWLIKSAILRYGGHTMYRQAFPFFIGLILGDFSAGFLRTIIDLAYQLYLPASSGLGGL